MLEIYPYPDREFLITVAKLHWVLSTINYPIH